MSTLHFAYLSVNIPSLTLPNGNNIPVDGGYYRATTICDHFGKNSRSWTISKAGKAFIADMSSHSGFVNICETRGKLGTFIHPILLLNLAKYVGAYDHFESQISLAKESSERRAREIRHRFRPVVKKPVLNLLPKTKMNFKPAQVPRMKKFNFKPASPPQVIPEYSGKDEEHDDNLDDFTQLIVRSNFEVPLEPFHEKIDIMNFAEQRLTLHGEEVDREYINWYIEHYKNKSWKAQATECCIDIEELVKMRAYCEKATARKNLIRGGFAEGIHFVKSRPAARQGEILHGGQNREIILLTPDCFKKMLLCVRNEAGEKVRNYYLIMEKVIQEYCKYETRYHILREEYVRTGAGGNSQAQLVINELEDKIKEKNSMIESKDKLIQAGEEKYCEQEKGIIVFRHQMTTENTALRHEIQLRDEKLNTMCAEQRALQETVRRHESENELSRMKMEQLFEKMRTMERIWPSM